MTSSDDADVVAAAEKSLAVLLLLGVKSADVHDVDETEEGPPVKHVDSQQGSKPATGLPMPPTQQGTDLRRKRAVASSKG